MDILEAIRTRRTVRLFKPDLLTDKQIMTILDAGRWEPSGKNRQPCRFIVIKNDKSWQRICELLLQYFYDFYGSRPENDPWRAKARRILDFIEKFCRDAPIFIAVLTDKTARALLSIPKELKLSACLSFGYPEKIPNNPSRKKMEEIAYYEKYGEKIRNHIQNTTLKLID